jgi:hypothetical protein
MLTQAAETGCWEHEMAPRLSTAELMIHGLAVGFVQQFDDVVEAFGVNMPGQGHAVADHGDKGSQTIALGH